MGNYNASPNLPDIGLAALKLFRICALTTTLCCAPVAADAPFSRPHSFSTDHTIGSRFQNIRLLGALRLDSGTHGGHTARELSGLAWDDDEGLLYALSDQGAVAHLAPRFENGILVAADLVAVHALGNAPGSSVKRPFTDSEGLAVRNGANGVRGDAELAVSFEVHPRIVLYTPEGKLRGHLALPEALEEPERYAKANASLEALTLHPEFGYVVAPQRPLKGADHDFTLHAHHGRTWTFAPLDRKHSAVLGLETTAEGDLLLVERVFDSIFKPVVFAVRRFPIAQLRESDSVKPIEVVHFSTKDDFALDNFESICHHRASRYFMVSDDNEHPLQRTLLIYFEILE